MPSLLQRQIFKEIANLFVLAVGVLLTLILISRAVQMRELFLGLDLGILDTVLLFGYMTPLFLMLVIPIACIAQRLPDLPAHEHGPRAARPRAGGINIYQMLPAPLLFSVICMLLTLWVSLHWLAWGMGHFRETILEIANTRARVVVQPGVFNTDFPNLVLFARQVNPGDGDMSQVLVDDRSHPERHMTILARKGASIPIPSAASWYSCLRTARSTPRIRRGPRCWPSTNTKCGLPLVPSSSLDLGDVRPREMSWSKLSSITPGGSAKSGTPTTPTSWRWSATSAGPIRWRASP